MQNADTPAERRSGLLVRRGAAAVDWPQLLRHLSRSAVIPVIGRDLLVVNGEHGLRPLTDYIAGDVAEILGLAEPGEGLPALDESTELHETGSQDLLDEIACHHIAAGNPVEDVYTAVAEALSTRRAGTAGKPRFEPPEVLRKLARIDAFRLFITTTFDDLLRDALDAERGPGTRVLSYSPSHIEDISTSNLDEISDTIVYHLLGRAVGTQEFVVTEEDTVEFVHRLQSGTHRPPNLIEAVSTHPLLIIGSGYPDWLARFFLRIAKGNRFLRFSGKIDYVADEPADESLRRFLQRFITQTKVFEVGGASFVDELSRRWDEQAGQRTAESTPERQVADEHAVFLSYAHEDAPTARALAVELRRLKVPVWIDHPVTNDDAGGLSGGDAFSEVIARQIHESALFVPLLSPRADTVQKRYFHREWNIAARMKPEVAPGVRWIVPIRVNGVPDDAQYVPDEFKDRHWLDMGEGTERVAGRLRELYRDYQLRRSGV